MIVRDESHVVGKTLETIVKHVPITSFVISDTGSTDNTIEIIESFFKERGVSGTVTRDEWRDFSYNRTLAIEHARRLSSDEYLFLFDADDSIHGVFPEPKNQTDMIMCNFGQYCKYFRPLFIRRTLPWRYRGVLHEYIESPPKATKSMLRGDYYIESGRTGARNRNPNKYADDARVLEKALLTETDPQLVNRYRFYLAQSYRDANMIDEAIRAYTNVIKGSGWVQERYVSCVYIGTMYEKKGQSELAI
jgi:glycosyltransferase involved in cell wall biosynthesis